MMKPKYGKKNFFKNLFDAIIPLTPLISACLLVFCTLFIVLSVMTYHPQDISPFYYTSITQTTQNKAGWLGAFCAAWLFYLFGIMTYGVIIYLLFVTVQLVIMRYTYQEEWDRIIAGWCTLFVGATWCNLSAFGARPYMLAGGIVGQNGAVLLRQYTDYTGAYAIIYGLTGALFFVITRLHFMVLLRGLFAVMRTVYTTRAIWLYPLIKISLYCIKFFVRIVKKIAIGAWQTVRGIDAQESQESLFMFEHGALYDTDEQSADDRIATVDVSDFQVPDEGDDHVVHHDQVPSFLTQEHAQKIQSQKMQKTDHTDTKNIQKKKLLYRLPSLALFSTSSDAQQKNNQHIHQQLSGMLEEKLARFGVQGKVVAIKPGPVITLFEYQPAIDAKVSKIIALENDLALALQAVSVRIVAPIPGTNRVGFEVANKERASVRMADIVRSSTFQQSKAALPLILGQDTSGGHVIVDLVKMPHLLVAGSTGSGKSVALNAMLASLVCKASPQELKFIIIDPKRLEFAAFHDIAHLLFPVITDPRRAAPVVKWLVKEMEDRYEYMAQEGARNITDYKAHCIQTGQEDRLPFIVLIIDELADLMMVAGKEIEESIARLAQMARAAGIHLIVATQRPSVDVLTGVIKVNFPSRISFRVTSKIDSRTILDAGGAENLLGKGDMLFMDAHSAGLQRIHGAYVSDVEITSLANHIRSQQQVQYQDLQKALESFHAQDDIAQEPLLPEVLTFLTTVEEISISSLQRRFKIGYNRSARLIELLESQGRVMPATGSKMRKVLKS